MLIKNSLIKLMSLFLKKIDLLVYTYPKISRDPDFGLAADLALIRIDNKFLVKKGEDLIHSSSVFFKSNLLWNFNFSKPYVIIGDCFTDLRYRGMGIYPKVIKFIAESFSSNRSVFILVDPNNLSSINGIEKSGFKYLGRINGVRILFFYICKRIIL